MWAALQGEVEILLVPASTAVNRLAPPDFLAAYTFEFKKGEKLDAEKFRSQVTLAGYAHVTQVVSPGEYSIRGGLIDLFPMGSQLPYRLDLFDDEIESIKTFDVDTQRTLYPVPEVRLLPAREFPMDDKGRTHFRQPFRERFEGDPAKSGIYKDISTGIASAGIEYYLPLFFDETASFSTTCRRMPFSSPTATCRPPSPPSGATPARATTCCRATRRGRCCRRKNCS